MTVLFAYARKRSSRDCDPCERDARQRDRKDLPSRRPEPPDWLRAVLVITVAVVIVAITRGRLRFGPGDPQVKAVSVDRRSIKG